MPDPTATTALAEALRAGDWEPDSNVCKCGHRGGEHDFGNWCLTCQRPEIVGPHTFSQRIDVGWCYFSSFSEAELWERATASILAHPWTHIQRAAIAAAILEPIRAQLPIGTAILSDLARLSESSDG